MLSQCQENAKIFKGILLFCILYITHSKDNTYNIMAYKHDYTAELENILSAA